MSDAGIRFITKVEDYVALLLLRTQTWGCGDGQLDINAYDQFSRPIGLFDEGGHLSLALRIVIPSRPNPYHNELVRAVESIDSSQSRRLRDPTPCRISTEESFPVSDHLDRLDALGRPYVEFGRLVGDPEHKTPGSIFRMMKFAIRETILMGYDDAFGSCRPEHARIWERFSFLEIPGIGKHIERYTRIEGVSVHAVWGIGARLQGVGAARDQ